MNHTVVESLINAAISAKNLQHVYTVCRVPFSIRDSALGSDSQRAPSKSSKLPLFVRNCSKERKALYNSSAKPHFVTVPATTHHSVESPIFPIPLLRSFPVSYPQLLHLSCHPKLVNSPERDRGEHHCAAHKECYVVLVQVDVGEEILGDLGAGAGVDDGHGVCCFCLFVCWREVGCLLEKLFDGFVVGRARLLRKGVGQR
jgi:hypothetical protein